MKLGLISDTHTPERWPDVPEAVYALFADCDLILHAGDVGELWVLDKLATIAPVVAVHGNDDSAESQRELPYRHPLFLHGQRILLWHGHYQDRLDEVTFRKTNSWQAICQRIASYAQRVGATIAITGHTHIPMSVQQDGVWIINPGAIASGNPCYRQKVQTVATLTLGSAPVLTHYDLATLQPHTPILLWDEHFMATSAFYEERIVDDAVWELFRSVKWRFDGELWPVVREALGRVAHRVWAGEQTHYTLDEVWAELGDAREVVEQVCNLR